MWVEGLVYVGREGRDGRGKERGGGGEDTKVSKSLI